MHSTELRSGTLSTSYLLSFPDVTQPGSVDPSPRPSFVLGTEGKILCPFSSLLSWGSPPPPVLQFFLGS